MFRTSLVRADDADATKSFNGRQLLDDSLTIRHSENTESERDGSDDRETFWDSGNGQRDWFEE
jgi:hypothetical protein